MRKRLGFTILELILAIALASIVILLGTNLMIFGMKGSKLTYDEFDVQSNVRIMSQKINTTIRDSAATFVLHRAHANSLTDGWNYIMLNSDKTKLIEYKWNPLTSVHDEKEIFKGIPGVTLNLEFEKDTAANIDKLLRYRLTVNDNSKINIIQSELESNNSLQVVDRSYSEIANTLAYRFDSRIDEVSNAQATVAMVLDRSGSMASTLSNGSANDTSSNTNSHSRMKKLKIEAKRLINELAKQPNIYISINPFSSTANSSEVMLKAQVNNTTNTGLIDKIEGLTASGGTNTGDGIRRAYYHIKNFNELTENTTKTNKNFMVILVDGVTTFASVQEIIEAHSISFSSSQGPTKIQDGKTYTFSHTSGFWFWTTYHYNYSGPIHRSYVTGDGDITNQQGSVNTTYNPGRYAGDGSNLDPWGTEYVDIIGQMVRDYKNGTNEAIKVYVIGFSSVPGDYGSLQDIAQATTGDTVYYEAGSSEALEAIFDAIERDISDALWHIGGPN